MEGKSRKKYVKEGEKVAMERKTWRWERGVGGEVLWT